MRIVCYIGRLCGGGAERVLSVLASGLSRCGHQVTMITDFSADNEYPLDETVERVIFDGDFDPRHKGNKIRTLRRVFRLHRFCKQEKVDIVISFMCNANFRGIMATRFLKTKNLISIRLDPKIRYKNKAIALLAKLLYPMSDGCVFQTDEAQVWFAPHIQKKSRIILNPVSDAFFQVAPAPMAKKRIVSCGRLDKQKRFDLLINAFDKLCDDFPEYKLEIYGIGELQEALQQQIDNLGRQDRITLMGRSSDVPNAIKSASLFVLASDYEGLPNALMEAMVLHLPAISTDCGGGGARALIEDGIDGKIVPCGDQNALTNAIREMLQNPEMAKQMGERAGQKAASFCTDDVVAQWETYIREIVEKL